MSDSDSSSDDDQQAIFQSVCDPTFSACFTGTNKEAQKYPAPEPCVQVTGDALIDQALHSLKMNMAKTSSKAVIGERQRLYPNTLPVCRSVLASSNSHRPSQASSSSTTLGGNAYLAKQLYKLMDSQIKIEETNTYENGQMEVEASTTCLQPPEDEIFPLIDGGLCVNFSLPAPAEMTTTDQGLRKLKKRHGYYYSSDEEEEMLARCAAVALPCPLPPNDGLRNTYTKFRNINPSKVETVRLCKSKPAVDGVIFISSDDMNNTYSRNNSKTSSQEKVAMNGCLKDAVMSGNISVDAPPKVKRKKNKKSKRENGELELNGSAICEEPKKKTSADLPKKKARKRGRRNKISNGEPNLDFTNNNGTSEEQINSPL